MTNKAVALLSGGLDSVVATKLATREYDVVYALTFDYGQRACFREIEVAQKFCKALAIENQIIKLPWLTEWTSTALVDRSKKVPVTAVEALDELASQRAKDVWVPNRNGIFVSIAAALAESIDADVIVAGFNAEEAATFPDNSAQFVKATNASLALSTLNRVRLISPTLDMTKPDIAKEFIALQMDSDSFWCCYEGKEKLCGLCESCVRTIRAFKEIGKWEVIRHRFIEL